MDSGGGMHKLPHNTYSKGNVRSGKSEVNETFYQKLVPSCINQPVTHITCKAMIWIYRCLTWLASCHTSIGQEIQSILPLRKKETMPRFSYLNTQKNLSGIKSLISNSYANCSFN